MTANRPTNKNELREILLSSKFISPYDNTTDLEAQIKQWVSETVIGVDEEDDLNPFGMMARSTGRNTLREDQRNRLEQS